MSVGAMFTALDKEAQEKGEQGKDEKAYSNLYDKAYRLISEWIHWGPRAILRAVDQVEWGVSGFTQTDWHAAGMAMAIACMALADAARILVYHFSLDKREQLSTFEERISKSLAKSRAAEFGTDRGML